MNFIGPSAKKKIHSESFVFKKRRDWINFIQMPVSSSRAVIWYKSKLQENFAVSCSLVTVTEMTDVQLAYWVTNSPGKDTKKFKIL